MGGESRQIEPIVLVHGYSAKSKRSTPQAIAGIYGSLPDALAALYPGQIVEIDLSRYVSLDDGVTVDDISSALQQALDLPWKDLSDQTRNLTFRRGIRGGFHELKQQSRPGLAGRPEVPFAIPYECAHSGKETGIVIGEAPREQVLRLIRLALERAHPAPPAGAPGNLADAFRGETEGTFRQALEHQAPPWRKKWLDDPRAQYDPHAQIIFRIRDQNRRPVANCDIFFDSVQGRADKSDAIKNLFEDKHINQKSPNIIVFYLPMRFEFDAATLECWIVGHRTTIIDVDLFRVPSPDVFRIVRRA